MLNGRTGGSGTGRSCSSESPTSASGSLVTQNSASGLISANQMQHMLHQHSATSTDTEFTTLDTNELWIQDNDPTPSKFSALQAFGAEMLKLSRGLEAAGQHQTTPLLNRLTGHDDHDEKISTKQCRHHNNLKLFSTG